jgi:diguanylate cyclase
LSSSARQRDGVARIGGEEFAIILPDTALHVAAETAERLRSKLSSKTFTIRATGQQISRISASFGVVQRNSDEDAYRLVRRADNLMYRAKSAGRNTVCW